MGLARRSRGAGPAPQAGSAGSKDVERIDRLRRDVFLLVSISGGVERIGVVDLGLRIVVESSRADGLDRPLAGLIETVCTHTVKHKRPGT